MESGKPNRRKRSPTEDKQFSYERDGRNSYGEAPHAARKAIPRFKKASTRQMRHGAKQIVAESSRGEAGLDEARLAAADRKGLRPVKSKVRDEPLGARVERGSRVDVLTEAGPAKRTRNRRESVGGHQSSSLWAKPVRDAGKKRK